MPSCVACAARHAASRVRRPGCVKRLRGSANHDPAELAERTVTYAGAPEVRSRWRLRPSRASASVAAAADVLAAAQVFLQRFGIEPMLPNGQRVSTLATEGARERATARRPPARVACFASHALNETQVDEECTSCGHRGLSFHTMQARPYAKAHRNAPSHSRSYLAARAAALGGRGANRVLRVPVVQAQVVRPHVTTQDCT